MSISIILASATTEEEVLNDEGNKQIEILSRSLPHTIHTLARGSQVSTIYACGRVALSSARKFAELGKVRATISGLFLGSDQGVDAFVAGLADQLATSDQVMMVFLEPPMIPKLIVALEETLGRQPSGAIEPRHGEGYIVKKFHTLAVTQ